MGWKDLLFAPLLKPTVVHRLPGRIRVHVPLLKQIPENWSHATVMIESLLAAPVEIEQVSVCRVTGNVLLSYDASAVDEARILQLFQKIAGLVATHGKTLASVGLDQLMAKQDQLTPLIEAIQGSQLDSFLSWIADFSNEAHNLDGGPVNRPFDQETPRNFEVPANAVA